MSVFNKLKEFKDMRSSAKKAQEILSSETITGQGAWGKILIEMSGTFEIKKVTIDDTLLGKKDDLQNGVKDAMTDAVKKVQFVLFKKRKELEELQK
jgi:DNA-binding YbaB/EbfC family protein